MLISLVNLDFVDMSKIDYGADYKRIIMRLKLKMDYFCRSPGILYFNIINYLFYPQIKIDLNDINSHLIVFSLMRFLSHIVILFFIFKVLLCPSLSRVSRPPFTQNSAATYNIKKCQSATIFGFFNVFSPKSFPHTPNRFWRILLCLLLFLFVCQIIIIFVHTLLCLLCLFLKLKMTGSVKKLYKYSDSIF